jgi:hypothetical protein
MPVIVDVGVEKFFLVTPRYLDKIKNGYNGILRELAQNSN